MIRVPLLLSLTILAMPAPALASEPAPAATTEATATKPEKPKKICRKAEESSYSRLGSGRVCKTAEEWAADDAKPKTVRTATRSVTAE